MHIQTCQKHTLWTLGKHSILLRWPKPKNPQLACSTPHDMMDHAKTHFRVYKTQFTSPNSFVVLMKKEYVEQKRKKEGKKDRICAIFSQGSNP